MADILNQGPAFWLPPDILSDDDDFLIPAAHNINRLVLHNYYQVQNPKMVPPQTTLEPSFKSPHPHLIMTPNGFRFPHPLPPRNHPLASLYAHKFMFQNRLGNRVFGYAGCSETMASPPPVPPQHSAWPPLSHQRPNTPPLLQCGSVFLNGSHEVKRKCAGTGVFLPRQYGNPISDWRKKPGLVTPPDQVPVKKNPVRFESHFIQNEDAEAMAARSRKKLNLRTEGEVGGSSNELCLPHEWVY